MSQNLPARHAGQSPRPTSRLPRRQRQAIENQNFGHLLEGREIALTHERNLFAQECSTDFARQAATDVVNLHNHIVSGQVAIEVVQEAAVNAAPGAVHRISRHTDVASHALEGLQLAHGDAAVRRLTRFSQVR